jgi:hypothetical protein
MPDEGFAHLIRAVIAIVLVLTLPVVLYAHTTGNKEIIQVYLDAMAAVVAFYFGASTKAR